MVGSFLRGIVGTCMTALAGVMFFVLLINGAPTASVVAVPVSFVVIGAYLRYSSRQTVRVRS